MKKLIYLLVLFSLNCKKDQNRLLIFEAGPQDNGYCEATRDKQKWSATAIAHIGPHFTKKYIDLIYSTYSNGALREEILLGGMLSKPGIYPVRGWPADTANVLSAGSLAIFESDGDVLGASYSTHETNKSSNITITKLDMDAGIVEGEFDELNFVLRNGDSYPPTLRYTGGKFSIKF